MSVTDPFKLSPGKLITLWIIDYTDSLGFTPTTSPILYLSAYRNGNSNILYDGNTYNYIGIVGTGFRSEINGAAPKPVLTIDKASLYSNAQFQTLRNEYITQTGEEYFDWRGAKVTRIQTFNLDITQQSKFDEYIVEQNNRITSDIMEIQLAVSLSIDRLNDQSIQSLGANVCSLRYRTWNMTANDFDYLNPIDDIGCPWGNPNNITDYTGVPSYNIKFFSKDDIELVPANKQYDACSQTVSGCQIRFDPAKTGLVLPFKGLYSSTSKPSGQ